MLWSCQKVSWWILVSDLEEMGRDECWCINIKDRSYPRRIHAEEIVMSSGFVRTNQQQSTTPFYSGVPSLDQFIFDGNPIPPGTVILLGEDTPRSRANCSCQLLRCFMAQATESNQRILYVGDQDDNFVTQLPAKTTTTSQKDEDIQNEKMSIAWRYKHLMTTDEVSSTTRKGSSAFDLSQMQAVTGKNVKSIVYSHSDQQDLSELFSGINAEIGSWLGKSGLLVMHSFASPFSMIGVDNAALMQFISRIKSLTRGANLLTIITMPPHRQSFNTSILLADCVLSMTSVDYDMSKRYEVEGFLKLIKPCFGKASMRPCIPTSTTLAYKIKRRRFIIEPFYLPPELDDGNHSNALLCSTPTTKDVLTKNPTSHLEF